MIPITCLSIEEAPRCSILIRHGHSAAVGEDGGHKVHDGTRSVVLDQLSWSLFLEPKQSGTAITFGV